MAFGGATQRLALIVNADTQGAAKELQSFGTNAEKSMGRAQTGVEKFEKRATLMGAGLVTAGVVALKGLSTLAFSAADVEEAQNKVSVVFGE